MNENIVLPKGKKIFVMKTKFDIHLMKIVCF